MQTFTEINKVTIGLNYSTKIFLSRRFGKVVKTLGC